MEQQKYLGIYVSKQSATAAVIARDSGKYKLYDCFSVALEQESEEDSSPSVGQLLAEEINKRKLSFVQTHAALDCVYCSQQKVHSAFSDVKQIAKTIAFDAEEALAADASRMAFAFEILNRGEMGSDVSVFACEKDAISEIILDMRKNQLEPVTIEPDSVCIRHYIYHQHKENFSSAIWELISSRNCYIYASVAGWEKPLMRTFVTSASQDKTSLSSRQTMLTLAAAGSNPEINKVVLNDDTDTVDVNRLSQSCPFEIDNVSLLDDLVVEQPESLDNVNATELIAACGAAMSHVQRNDRVDFRPGFMPFEGKKALLEQTVKMVSILVLVIFIALGFYLQLQYMRTKSYQNQLYENLETEFKLAMPGASLNSRQDPVKRLEREINKIKSLKSGQFSAEGENSVAAKLSYLLEAMVNVDKNVDIEIDSISITASVMKLTGSTSPRGYLKLFESIDNHPRLIKGEFNYRSKDNRDRFTVNVELVEAKG